MSRRARQRQPVRLTDKRRLLVYGVGIALWTSGALWLIFHYLVTYRGEFGATTHPLEPWWLKAHGAFAFAGIGDPERFFRTLRSSGVEVARTRSFADHHVFSQAEIAGLIEDSRREELTLVTTEKDRARMRGIDLPREILHFAITLEFDDPAALRQLISDQLYKARERRFSRR